MTAAQALVEGLIAEGVPIVLGIFGHGNVQLGQALSAARDRIRFIPVKNEQAAVHTALAYARMCGRPLAVTTSIGPGATNLVTGAACARINRWPVLLLPGEIFSEGVGPLLQQLESPLGFTVNDTLRPVSKYFARLSRPEQLRRALREAFDAMLEPGDEGPATLCLPMDVQAEAADYDERHFARPAARRLPRIAADPAAVAEAGRMLAEAEHPICIAGGGVLRSGAEAELRALAEDLEMPIAQTQAGKGAVMWDHRLNLFAVGPTGTAPGNWAAARADVVLGIGTRYADFTTSSETAFPRARFINLNLCYSDVKKQAALDLLGDAKTTLIALREALATRLEEPKLVAALSKRREDPELRAMQSEWRALTGAWLTKPGTPLRQSTALGVINRFVDPRSVVISAAGSLPGDLQKLWRDRSDDGKGYICEYGYSTMGFEVAAGLGARLACPDREAIVLCGDLSFLMSSQELVTAVELGIAFTVVVFDNHGGQSIRSLQRGRGFNNFSMELRTANGGTTAVDYVKLAEGMGCIGLRAHDGNTLEGALRQARAVGNRPTVIQVEIDRDHRIGDTGGWWDVPIPAVDAEGRETMRAGSTCARSSVRYSDDPRISCVWAAREWTSTPSRSVCLSRR